MDKKGIALYITFSMLGAFVLIPLLIHLRLVVFHDSNVAQKVILMSLLWIPGCAALLAHKAAPHPDFPRPVFWPLPIGRSLAIGCAVLLGFAVIYGVSTAFRWTVVQWDMATMMNTITENLQQPLTPGVLKIVPIILLTGGLFLSVVLGMTFYAALALGTEWGWRGFLLPRLMPLGRIPAYGITGILWGIWCLPFLLGMYRVSTQQPNLWLWIAQTFGMTLVLSFCLGEIWRRGRHVGLAAVALGSFCAQTQGIWEYLFQMSRPPYTGAFGLVSIIVWGVFAVLMLALGGFAGRTSKPSDETPTR